MTRVAINGLGRIGRAVLKIILDTPELELVAINDLVPPDNLAYLLRYDTVYGKYPQKIDFSENSLIIAGQEYKYFQEKDPQSLPWKELNLDVVFECTGVFRKKEGLEKHLQAGAKKVVLSAPAKSEGIEVIVPGVSEASASENNSLISCASCTTNCIAPVMEIAQRRLGVKKAIMTTIHAYTTSQGLVDQPSKKFRRGRAAAVNLVPTTTGAAIATTQVLPQLENKFDGVAVRTPVPVGSITDIVVLTEQATSVEAVNQIFREESQTERYQGILGISEDQIVSSDIVGDSRASVVDLTMTKVIDGDLVKVMSWYDNEWGYANQMIREVLAQQN
ncbi:MAG TPA: type I glyceraldehyde-3-phosphate dehydrogenase [Xenococcaceae cyanobacterium]|jgi:glyceraldehyde 3-phosphate dehydrogenase